MQVYVAAQCYFFEESICLFPGEVWPTEIRTEEIIDIFWIKSFVARVADDDADETCQLFCPIGRNWIHAEKQQQQQLNSSTNAHSRKNVATTVDGQSGFKV